MRNLNKNPIYVKSFKFSIRIYKLYSYLCRTKKEYIISKQVLRSGTSICANVNEGIEAQSKKDFVSKMSIALKESRETQYWIELSIAVGLLQNNIGHSLLNDLNEILNILTSIVKTCKINN